MLLKVAVPAFLATAMSFSPAFADTDAQADTTNTQIEAADEAPEFVPGSLTPDEVANDLGLPNGAECDENPENPDCYIIEPAGGASVIAEVDLKSQQLSVYINGQYRETYYVSTGSPGHGTPTGTFRVWGAHKNKVSKKYGNAPMPNALPFTSVYHALHCGNVSSGFLSHGCVRVERSGCEDLWNIQSQYGYSSIVVRIAHHNPNVVVTNRGRPGSGKVAATTSTSSTQSKKKNKKRNLVGVSSDANRTRNK